MKNQDDRYIRLNGYPLHRPLWSTLHESAGIRAGMLCSAFTIAAEMLTHGQEHLGPVAIASIAIPVAAGAKYQIFEYVGLSAFFPESDPMLKFIRSQPYIPLIIDTQPDARTEPTSLINLNRARLMRTVAQGAVGIYGSLACLVGLSYISMQNVGIGDIAVGLGISGQMLAPCISTWVSCAQRFNRVMKGDYAIIDPPPKPAKQAEGIKQLSALQPT